MPFRVIQPPSDPEQFTEEGKRLYTAGKALGVPLEPEGFLHSWVSGTRVVVEEVDGEVVGFVLLAVGQRWTHSDATASALVLETKGDYDGLVEFLKQICAALGAAELFIQNRAVRREGDLNYYTVVGHLLG